MTTRRRVFLVVATSLGAIGSAGGLATLANAAPDRSLAQIEAAVSSEVLNELCATNQQLQAELEDEKALTAGLEKINLHLRLGFDQLRSALATTRGTQGQYHCSFCGKSQDQVRRLIAGPGAVYICDECVDLCRDIIYEESAPPAAAKDRSLLSERTG